MTIHPDYREIMRALNRELQQALRDCDQLLERARNLHRETGQDNDPPPRA